MARLRFRKPKIGILITEIISLSIWLYLGDEVINVLDGIVGNTLSLNLSDGTNFPANTNWGGCTNESVFRDAYEILGIGYDCDEHLGGINAISSASMRNADDGLLGVIGLVMVVMVLMNFVTYN